MLKFFTTTTLVPTKNNLLLLFTTPSSSCSISKHHHYPSIFKFFTTSTTFEQPQQSFTISYLINNCGFTPQTAFKASHCWFVIQALLNSDAHQMLNSSEPEATNF
ncbi:hypothetical protein QL285_095447 [Trifolium repens]|nr:hypothetical protein QL285_095447 [Trifolium repens]